jgi:DHA1 family tetracycline resistance protein-like MFS transporter
MTFALGTRRAAFAFIFVTVALDMLALGIAAPVLPKLLIQLEGGNTGRAAPIFGLFGLGWWAMQFLFSPLTGVLSDRFGRRPVVLLSNFGLGLDYVLMALAPSVAWLFVGRLASGITAATFSVAGAYVADVTPPERRAALFGMLGAAFGFGFILGPALGGVLGAIDLRLPFWVAAALSFANFAYGFTILPESLPPERRAPFAWGKANPVGSLKMLRGHPELFGLAAATFLYYIAHESLPGIFVLYADYRYHWDERTVGLVLAGIGVGATIVSAFVVGPVVARLRERNTLILGAALGALGFAIYGLAPTGALFLAGLPFISLWGLMAPSMQALMSARVGPSAQGELQGALGAMRGIAGMLGQMLFTYVLAFAITAGGTPAWSGLGYLTASVLILASLAIAVRATARDS